MRDYAQYVTSLTPQSVTDVAVQNYWRGILPNSNDNAQKRAEKMYKIRERLRRGVPSIMMQLQQTQQNVARGLAVGTVNAVPALRTGVELVNLGRNIQAQAAEQAKAEQQAQIEQEQRQFALQMMTPYRHTRPLEEYPQALPVQPPPQHHLTIPINNALRRYVTRDSDRLLVNRPFENLVTDVENILVADNPNLANPRVEARRIANVFMFYGAGYYLANHNNSWEMRNYLDEVTSAILWGDYEFSNNLVRFTHPMLNPLSQEPEPPPTDSISREGQALQELMERLDWTNEELFEHNFRQMFGGGNVSIPAGIGIPTSPIEMPDAWDWVWDAWFRELLGL